MTKPLVSIIVPTRNSIRTVENVLKSIKAQTYSPIEIIVVDQGSTDGTLDVAKKYTSKIYSTKGDKFYSAPPVSRNIGAKAAKGKYLYHLDSDMQLTSKVVEECVDLLEKNPDILAAKVHETDIGEGFWTNAKKLERRCYVGFDLIEAARFIRKSTFTKLGGYDETLRSAEDWDMSQRISDLGKIGSVSAFTKHNLGKMRYFYQVKKKFNYGLTLERIFKKHKFSSERKLAMIFRSAYLKNWRLFLEDPKATLGFLILRPSEITAYVLGVVWARVKKIKT
jgi:glycosyltransferase involved in cell wall biosynthesis